MSGALDWLNTFRYTAPANNAAAQGETNFFGDSLPQSEIRDGVCIIPITGILINGASYLEKMQGAQDYKDIEVMLADANANPSCRAIVLAIISPAAPSAVPELSDTVAASEKLVIAFTDSLCASAALCVFVTTRFF